VKTEKVALYARIRKGDGAREMSAIGAGEFNFGVRKEVGSDICRGMYKQRCRRCALAAPSLTSFAMWSLGSIHGELEVSTSDI